MIITVNNIRTNSPRSQRRVVFKPQSAATSKPLAMLDLEQTATCTILHTGLSLWQARGLPCHGPKQTASYPVVRENAHMGYATKTQPKCSPYMQHIENKLFILDIPLMGKKCHSREHLKNRRTEPGVRGETLNLSDYVWLPFCCSNSSGSALFRQCGFC